MRGTTSVHGQILTMRSFLNAEYGVSYCDFRNTSQKCLSLSFCAGAFTWPPSLCRFPKGISSSSNNCDYYTHFIFQGQCVTRTAVMTPSTFLILASNTSSWSRFFT